MLKKLARTKNAKHSELGRRGPCRRMYRPRHRLCLRVLPQPLPIPAEPGLPSQKSGQSEVAPSIAAEVVDANNGRRLRIFNGADQATVTALISALASLSGCGSGF